MAEKDGARRDGGPACPRPVAEACRARSTDPSWGASLLPTLEEMQPPASPQGLQIHVHWADTTKPTVVMAGPPRSRSRSWSMVVRLGQCAPAGLQTPLLPAGFPCSYPFPPLGWPRLTGDRALGGLHPCPALPWSLTRGPGWPTLINGSFVNTHVSPSREGSSHFSPSGNFWCQAESWACSTV